MSQIHRLVSKTAHAYKNFGGKYRQRNYYIRYGKKRLITTPTSFAWKRAWSEHK